MNYPQNTFCTACLSPIKLVLRVFAHNTTFANSFWSFDGWEAFNHGMFLKLMQVFEVQMMKSIMPYPTDLIPISQKSGGVFIHHKLGKLIGLSSVICYACCKEFPGCNLYDFNIIRAEINSLLGTPVCVIWYTLYRLEAKEGTYRTSKNCHVQVLQYLFLSKWSKNHLPCGWEWFCQSPEMKRIPFFPSYGSKHQSLWGEL